ncbi:DUF885 domain-containing protein [Sphingobium lignivorans]|uniref:Uncharacterized protein (DUF885 family) n=1 Tax=Sphingobium lignivorans TaxID=2735886 RepID=A0ABR6NJ68_9SPHN|nr:uncharacterized protein (DUF885 family) [Sphingobium lignivorans]
MPVLPRGIKSIAFAISLALAAPAFATPAEDLAALLDEHWQWSLTQDPTLATMVGDRRYDDRLGDYSLEAADRQTADNKRFLARLDAIPDAGLSEADKVNRLILRRNLVEAIEGNGFGQRMMLFSSFYSPWQSLAGLGEMTSFRNAEDYRNYLKRLASFPAINETLIGITRKAVAGGYVQACVTLGGLEGSIRGVIPADPTRSRLYAPFAGPRPGTVSEADWTALQAEAKTLLSQTLAPAFARAADYVAKDYMPRCAQSVSVSSQPDGAKYYAYRVRAETTTDLTPEQIHKIGLDEVARIDAEMVEVAKSAGFADKAAFVRKLRTDPAYYAKTPEELMSAAARIAKTIDGKMPGYFHKLPRLPYGIREIPAEIAEGTTTAYYNPGSPDTGIAGFYYVNTSKLDQRPLYELPALTLHEAVPGHHNQIALQQELDLPPLRKYLAHFTAFVEGWALYTEVLGFDMGLYDTPEKHYGRLSYEMWRACRLVVDTGIHAKGWTKQQAVDFMLEHTALSAANIDAEVNRYISWPGQALGYKIGEIRIRELRARAEKALGERFDLRGFHDTVIGQGSVPLDVLERQVDDWIAVEKAKAAN